jgi:hypothetical protein
VATSVTAGPLIGADQLLSSQWDLLNRDLETRYQQDGMPSMNIYSTGTANGLDLPSLPPSSDQMSQCDNLSKNGSPPLTREYATPPISPPTAACLPGQNDFCPHITQPAGGPGRSPGYLANFQPCAPPSAGLQQKPALPGTCMTHQGFTRPSMRPHCRGCCACNTVIWEPTPTVLQPGMNSLTRMNSHFDSPSSSGIREQTVPGHLFYANTPPEGAIPQSSGS